jgi:hypothetical protein
MLNFLLSLDALRFGMEGVFNLWWSWPIDVVVSLFDIAAKYNNI